MACPGPSGRWRAPAGHPRLRRVRYGEGVDSGRAGGSPREDEYATRYVPMSRTNFAFCAQAAVRNAMSVPVET
jgi:hypothetical protein